jgi:ribosomal protein S18 acetylase RimI-like enzyme
MAKEMTHMTRHTAMTAITIRMARPDDLAAVVAIARAAFALYVPRMDREPAPMLADYAALIRDGSVWIAEHDDGIAGFLVGCAETSSFFVETVAIDPALQGAGLGRRMMHFAEDQALRHGCDAVALYTNVAMRENIAFYDRLGYTVTDQRIEDGYQRVYFAKPL